jgi:TorA maturation chaperone TorD
MNAHTENRTDLLAQADLLLLLADLLRRPADAQARLRGVVDDDLRELVRAASQSDAATLAPALIAAVDAGHELALEEWSDEYHRLFEGAMLCALNETAFIRRDKGAILGDLAGYYRAFGWSPTGQSGEKLDHLVTELEFAGLLLAMLAGAPRHSEEAAVTRQALASFAADHLGDWMASACERLGDCTVLPFYRCVAKAAELAWAALGGQHGWPVAASAASTSSGAYDPESPYECGAANAGETGCPAACSLPESPSDA